MLFVNVMGACIASAAIIPLRDVAGLVQARSLRWAWWGLTVLILCCIGLLLTAAAASIDKVLDGSDLATTGIHILGPIFVLGVGWLSRLTAHEMLRIKTLEQAAFTDALTGLANRRRFDECLLDEVRRARATGLPLSLLVLDVDHFKRVNDAYGHAMGDLVLRHVAMRIGAKCRPSDTACRTGGEEFVVLMPGLEGASAHRSAERLRRAVAEADIPTEGGNIRVTISLGLATLCSDETADALLRRADAALYDAKRGGRDRVTLAA